MNRALGILVAACSLLAACGQNMTSQPKYSEYKPARLFANGRVLQAPVPGTIARGDLDRAREAAERPPLDLSLLAHGRESFDVFCSPCHAPTGEGDGIIVRRGMPRPPSFDEERLRNASDQHFFDVITHGHGAMYSYAARVPPKDRWAIVAYIRALQLSQHATLEEVPAEQRHGLLAKSPQ